MRLLFSVIDSRGILFHACVLLRDCSSCPLRSGELVSAGCKLNCEVIESLNPAKGILCKVFSEGMLAMTEISLRSMIPVSLHQLVSLFAGTALERRPPVGCFLVGVWQVQSINCCSSICGHERSSTHEVQAPVDAASYPADSSPICHF